MIKKISILIFLTHTILQAQTYKYGKVSMDELTETSYALDPTAPAAILYNERVTTFEYESTKGFFIVEEYFVRLKIYNKEGFDYATKKIALYVGGSSEGEKAKSIKGTTYTLENNQIVKTKLENDAVFFEETNKYWDQVKFTMPNLKEGCVVEWAYRFESPFIFKLDEVVLQTEIPIKKNFVKINIPEYFVYNRISKGYFSVPFTTDKRERTISYSYEAFSTRAFTKPIERVNSDMNFNENIINIENSVVPAIINEPFSGNVNNFTAGIVFELSYTKFPNSIIDTYTTDWEAAVKTIYDNEDFGGQMKDVSYISEGIQQATEGKTSETDRINGIFNFIKTKIKHNDYLGRYTDEGVKKAYKNGLGNVAEINLNLINMLRAAGFDANPVLVCTVSNGIPLYPSISAFNYVVVAVNTTQGKVLLDASVENSTFNILPERAVNFNGREVRSDGKSEWINLYPQKHSIAKTTLNIKFNEGGFEGNSRVQLNGVFAMDYRDEMRGKTREATLELLNKEKENIDVLDFRITNLDDLDKDINEVIKFETESFYEEISGKTYISPMLYLQITENPFKTEKREFPIFFNKPWASSITINISVPENYVIETLPESKEVILPNDLGGFVYKLTQNGQNIQVDSNIFINQPIIQASDYQIIKDFYKDIIIKQAEKIVLVKN